ncbi:FBP domain-containing protein [Streptomyces qinzhouensis]|nr:FBP domain-containing protein [Streptomyces qinzhouensis]
MTREEIRGAIVNPDTTGTKVRLPTWFDDVRWDRIDYLGWRDLRSPQRAYLVTEADGQALGVLLRQAPNDAAHNSRAMMCDLCRFTRRFNEISLFTARLPSRDKRKRLNTVGLLLCTDLDCAVKLHSKPIRQPFDPPDEEMIEQRRVGMRSRTITFIHSVSAWEQTTRRKK